MEKVFFRLEQDDDGYPPFAVESVWATKISDDLYRIENIPFFARQATWGDVVKTLPEDNCPFFERMREPSGNSLLRVIVNEGHDPQQLRDALLDLGCESEQSHLRNLFALNVPAEVSIVQVRAMLNAGFQEGWLEYEEPILRQ